MSHNKSHHGHDHDKSAAKQPPFAPEKPVEAQKAGKKLDPNLVTTQKFEKGDQKSEQETAGRRNAEQKFEAATEQHTGGERVEGEPVDHQAESKKGDTTEQTAQSAGNRPDWWTEGADPTWAKAKTDVMGEWSKIGQSAQKIERSLAEAAAEFGHRARTTYGKKLEGWGDDVEHKLQDDWKRFEAGASDSWEKVRSTVKLGWERAINAVVPGAAKEKGGQHRS